MFIDFLELCFSQIAKCRRNDTYDGSLAVLKPSNLKKSDSQATDEEMNERNPQQGNFLYSVYKTDVTAHKLQTF